MALLSLDRHDVLETIRHSNGLHEAFLRVAKLPAVGEYKTLTNADRIRAMTDEELAVVIAWPYLASPPWCAEHTTCPYINEDPTPCDKCALDWLKQEASE